MNKPNPVEEPSMEEILASIRRIISDGEEAPAARPEPEEDGLHASAVDDVYEAPAPSAEEPPSDEGGVEDDEILDLTEEMSMEDAAEPALTETYAEEAESDTSADTPEAEPNEPEVMLGHDKQPPPGESAGVDPAAVGNGAATDADFKVADQLLSPTADAHVTAAFGRLAHTILSQDARTLEDLVQEMLRPMLKEWLDDNLPQLVERLVRAEIERVSRGKV